MKKPILNEIDIKNFNIKGKLLITITTGQKWDSFLDEVYKSGGVVLELDKNECLVKAYQKEEKEAKNVNKQNENHK